jgi:hypothetical protein
MAFQVVELTLDADENVIDRRAVGTVLVGDNSRQRRLRFIIEEA